jgi:hypothetical protein
MITQSRITLKEQVPDLVDRFGRLLLEPPTREKPPIGRMLSCQSYETGWAASATNGGSCSIADYTDDFTYGTQSKILTVTAAAGRWARIALGASRSV